MLDAITFGQYVPARSFLHGLDPRTKVLGVLALGGSVLAAGSALELLAVLAVTALAVSASGVPLKLYARAVLPLKYILAAAFVVQALASPGGQVIWAAGRFSVTAGGLTGAAFVLARVLLLLTAASALTFTTPPTRVAAAVEALLSPLKKLGVPAAELSLAMTVALRFIPVLLGEAQLLLKAQRSRGAGAAGRGPVKWAQLTVSLLVPLIAGAIRRAEELAVAMESRGYRPGAARTRLLELKMQKRDAAVLALLGALFLGTVLWGG